MTVELAYPDNIDKCRCDNKTPFTIEINGRKKRVCNSCYELASVI